MLGRKRRMRCFVLVSLLSVFSTQLPAAEPLTFERDVRPILKAHCFHCHGEGDELKGHLDLRLKRLLVKGGDGGTALSTENPKNSLLLERVRDGEMPPDGKSLPPGTLEILTRWVEQGAVAGQEPEDPAAATITAEERAFWSFQPIQNPPVPMVQHADLVKTPVDAFLLATLESKGLSFSAEAEPRVLLRRATFDLLGLPPTAEEIAAFEADTQPGAYERLIDRLLASPHYGERWGRHWLDVAGYADSDGYVEADPVRPYAWKYRDYVIRAFNNDMPFDQFIVEQLAGDELVPPPYKNMTAEQIERLTATGFLRTVPDGVASEAVQKVARNAVIAETIKVVSTSLLGMTVGCAECHNHRYDPIPAVDYYRFRALFEPALDWKSWRPPQNRLISLATDQDREVSKQIEAEAVKVDEERKVKQDAYIAATLEKEFAKLPAEKQAEARAAKAAAADKRTPEQIQLLKDFPSLEVNPGTLYLYDAKAAADLKAETERATKIRETKPKEDFVSPLTEEVGVIPETVVFYRGDPDQPKQAVTPAELSVLEPCSTGPIAVKDAAVPTSGRRLAYARNLTSGKHPLVGRVLVNRFWMQHFGRGIVATAGDFGFLGERPTHPELLDWLATDFMANGWKLKRFHRQLMLSTVYRQTSLRSPAAEALDPDNRLLGRISVRRLESEAVRDSLLSISGKLNAKLFGPAVPVMEDDVGQIVVGIENKNGENRPGEVIPLKGEEYRRSVYVQVRRSRPLTMLEPFDLPALEPNCTARNSSTVAPQSLLLMNGDFVLAAARDFATRLQAEGGMDVKAQLQRAWRLSFGRPPADAELQQAELFLNEQRTRFTDAKSKEPELQALSTLCQALFGSNEFLYVE